MQPYDDQQLMAYADGELSAAQAEAIRAAAQRDAGLARRIERFAATRSVLRRTLDARGTEPVPQRLLDLLASPAAQAKVVPLRRKSTLWQHWQPMALAASVVLVVGLLSARQLLLTPDSLSMALEKQPSGLPYKTAQGEIVALSTLRLADGSYCREFERSQSDNGSGTSARGLACRGDAARWAERSIAAAPPQPAAAGYQTAAGETKDAAAALGAHRISVAQERELIKQQWR